MKNSRPVLSILLAAALIVPAGILYATASLAGTSQCCCSGDACRCCIQHGESEQAPMLSDAKQAAACDCSCSGNPSPDDKYSGTVALINEFNQKRLLQVCTISLCNQHNILAKTTPPFADRPPLRLTQCLFRIKCSLRL